MAKAGEEEDRDLAVAMLKVATRRSMSQARATPFKNALGAIAVVATIASTVSCEPSRPTFSLDELAAQTSQQTLPSPWYVVHGMIAGGTEVELKGSSADGNVNIVDYLTTQQELTDQSGNQVDILYEQDGLPRYTRTDGQYIVQGHPNQFLAALLERGVPLTRRIDLRDGDAHTLADALESVKREISPARIIVAPPPGAALVDNELGFSIGLLANSVGTDAEWQNEWGETVSVAALVAISLQRPPGWGSCAGTHELYGLARALKVHRATHNELSGIWATLDRYLEDAKARARVTQDPDGWFNPDWGRPKSEQTRSGVSSDRKVAVTGHMLEWLVLASAPEQLADRYMQRAYGFLERTRFSSVSLEAGKRGKDEVSYGPLTHAVHGMNLYRESAGIMPVAAATRRSTSSRENVDTTAIKRTSAPAP